MLTLPYSSTFSPLIDSFAVFQANVLWAVVIAFVLAFLLGFGMGANDVSNAFGTSVGSGVLTLTKAYILATVFESLGSILVGYTVTDTMRKGVVDVAVYNGSEKELIVGQIAILGGCSAWLLLATALNLPVSTTHSLVGATLGFSLLQRGIAGIRWMKVVKIVMSWFVSPAVSGAISTCLYLIVDHAVLRRKNSLVYGMRALPIFYFLCVAINVFAVTFDGSKVLGLDNLPFWGVLAISLAFATLAAIIVQFVMVPRAKVWIDESDPPKTITLEVNGNAEQLDNNGKKSNPRAIPADINVSTWARNFFPSNERLDDERTLKLFSFIQVLTACFAGFAHGSNDVSNAIAPLTAVIEIYQEGNVFQRHPIPIYLLIFGTVSMCTGLWALGHRVINTVGKRISHINPASGFIIEFSAAITILLASKLGLPLSTTHCLIGAVVAVGALRSGGGNVDWSLFRHVALSWIVTVPISGIFAATIMFVLNLLVDF